MSVNKESNAIQEEPPKAPKSKLKLKDFLALIEYYRKRVLKQTASLCKDDMKVLHDLLIEVISYLSILSPLFEFAREREQLYAIAIDIVEHLDIIYKSPMLPSYPSKMKVKLHEAQFEFLFKHLKDFSQAEIMLNKIIKLQEESNFPMFNRASALFFAALIRFQLNDINSAEDIAKRSLDILENKLYFDANEIGSAQESKEFEDKKVRKISNVLEFLAEIYVLEKNFNSAISAIENAYYLNLGFRGIEHKQTEKFYDQLERLKQQKMFYHEETEEDCYKDDFKNRKIAQGNIRVFSGKGENYAFKVPFTNLSEPYLISLYKEGGYSDKNNDSFSPSLFLANLYMDKSDLFKYLRIPEPYRENHLLFTDENMNIFLEHIIVDEEHKLSIDDQKLKAIIFSSFTHKAQA